MKEHRIIILFSSLRLLQFLKTIVCAEQIGEMFTFFLSLVYEYWNACVYNLDEQFFLTLISTFLSSLCHRTSEYLPIRKYRTPWPPYLVSFARTVNKHRRKYRGTRFLCHLNTCALEKRISRREDALLTRKKRELFELVDTRTKYLAYSSIYVSFIHFVVSRVKNARRYRNRPSNNSE